MELFLKILIWVDAIITTLLLIALWISYKRNIHLSFSMLLWITVKMINLSFQLFINYICI